jgi:RNA polymerase sigma-54 factor
MAMRFEQSQGMKLGQSMKLSPRVIQSMEILQLPLTELEERIEHELENNIALEIAEPERDDFDEPVNREEAPDASSDSFEHLDDMTSDVPDIAENEFDSSARVSDRYEDDSYRTASRQDGEPDAKSSAMANAPARTGTLQDQLLDQWRLTELDDNMIAAGVELIGYLDDDGFLRTSFDDIIQRASPALGLTSELLERSLQALQLVLEPPGVAARDVSECLLLQLDAIEAEPTLSDEDQILARVRALISEHLDDLSQNRMPKVAEATGYTMDEIKESLEFMRRLSLAPARQLVQTRPEVITPDAVVEYNEEQDSYYAYLHERRSANLRVNEEYARLSTDKSLEKKDRDFIKTNLSNASWLIDAVSQRSNTLLRVIRVVVDAQRDYFDYGPTSLRPLPMTQVADQIGVHVATVSRAVSDKYLQTPRGIVPLRSFFTGGLATESGEDMSYDAVKAALREIVDEEDPKKPLSDDALATALKERGIEIARRTVAKYRGQLDIPSARIRKQH